jgi:hypothetical protein
MKRCYGPMGNVADMGSRVPQGMDYQAFCYDEQNRLTWASSATGSVPFGGSWMAGSLYGPYRAMRSMEQHADAATGQEGEEPGGSCARTC